MTPGSPTCRCAHRRASHVRLSRHGGPGGPCCAPGCDCNAYQFSPEQTALRPLPVKRRRPRHKEAA